MNISSYITLCKPRVVMLMILTSMVGMCLATTQHLFSWQIFFLGNLGIALMACSAAAVNHLVDQRIDRLMRRTEKRPLVQGNITARNAIIFASVIGAAGLFILIRYVNNL